MEDWLHVGEFITSLSMLRMMGQGSSLSDRNATNTERENTTVTLWYSVRIGAFV